MSKFPGKPPRGSNAFQSFYNSICEIIDYLPSLAVRGDNKTIKVNEHAFGRTIQAIPQSPPAGSVSGETPAPVTPIQVESATLAKTISANNKLNIKVKLYPNGPDGAPSAETYNLFIPNLAEYRDSASKYLDYGKSHKFNCNWR